MALPELSEAHAPRQRTSGDVPNAARLGQPPQGGPALATAPLRPPDAAALRWVEECLGQGSTVKMVRPLIGGSNHANHALLATTRSGAVHRLVLRRWTRMSAAFSPEREIAALALLSSCEIPTPSLVAADPSGAYCDVPALLITRLVGHPPRPAPDDASEYLIQLAAALLPIHALGGATTMPPYRSLGDHRPPTDSDQPDLWERAFEAATGPAPYADHRFIHGDYHPDNTLWAYGRLTGVVDWTGASYGPIAVDVASMRLSLALRYGPDMADRFRTTFDQVHGGCEHDPYWDIRAVAEALPGLSPSDAAATEDYLARLLAELT